MPKKQRRKRNKIRIPIPKCTEIHKDKKRYNRKEKYRYDWTEEYDPLMLDDDRIYEYEKGEID